MKKELKELMEANGLTEDTVLFRESLDEFLSDTPYPGMYSLLRKGLMVSSHRAPAQGRGALAYQAPIKWAKSRQNAVISRVGRTICRTFPANMPEYAGIFRPSDRPSDRPTSTQGSDQVFADITERSHE